MQNSIGSIVFTADIEQTASTLLAKMTLAEKIGQMTQVEKNSITPVEVTEYHIGSILSGGGGNPEVNNVQNWAAMVRSFQEAALQTRLQIPILYGVDAVHGHNNVKGTVIFPHNIGLGATRDAALIQKIGEITAKEILATGVTWTFAPALSVPQDIRWGRTYEGFSDDPAIVAPLATAYIHGLQEGNDVPNAIGCAKHYVADGGTTWGSSKLIPWQAEDNWQAATERTYIDQGDAQIDEETLRRTHLAPYFDAINAGVYTVMTSFSSWNGDKMHGHHYLVTDVLKGEMGFNGFVVSDWNGIDQLDADFYTCVVKSINAGLDMNMVPYDFRRFITTLTQAVDNGDVSIERIDDAVMRILRVKIATGLFEQPFGDESLGEIVGSAEHRALAREAVNKSLVLLKNEGDLLPLSKDIQQLVVVGSAANDIGLQCGGWSIEWQGKAGPVTDGTTIWDGIQAVVVDEAVTVKADGQFADEEHYETGLVVIAEAPYAEGLGDTNDLSLSTEDIALIENTTKHCDRVVLVLMSGRPRIVDAQLDLVDAFVAAWLPGTEGNGVTDVLFGDKPFVGTLSFNWPQSQNQIPLSALHVSHEAPQWCIGDGIVTA